MNEPRQMFTDSRGVLLIFCPVLAIFFTGFAYYVYEIWNPATLANRIMRTVLIEVLLSFIMLCAVGFIVGIIGPQRLKPVIARRYAIKAILAAMALIVSVTILLLYCGFTA